MPRPSTLRRRSSSQRVRRSKRIAAAQQGRVDEEEGMGVEIHSLPVSKHSSPSRETNWVESYMVEFQGEGDPTNPYNWPSSRKWTIVAVLSFGGFLGNLGTLISVPAIPQILRYFGSSNKIYETALVSVWEIGEAIGPLFVAPLSEIFGRAVVYNTANVWFTVMAAASGGSQNLSMLLAFRLLNGAGDSSQSLNAGIVGDMFHQERRGLAIALTSFPPMLGPVAGPVIGGYLSEALGWRWTFWLSALLGGVCALTFAIFYRESYGPTILRAKAARIRRATGLRAYHSRYDYDVGTTRTKQYVKGISRPLLMLVQLPVVAVLAVYMSIQFGLLYVVLATATELVEQVYGFTEGEAGLAYLGISVGMLLGVLTCALTLDPLLRRQQRREDSSRPEARFPPTIVGAIGMPLGLLIYGWTARPSIHWIVPLLGSSIVGYAFYVASVPLQAYLVDAYTIHSASAIAATVAARCTFGALLPIAAPPIFSRLSYGQGCTVFAALGIISIPLPIYVMRCGETLRNKYKSLAAE